MSKHYLIAILALVLTAPPAILAQCEPFGTPCDDGNPETLVDIEDGDCNCVDSSTFCDDFNPCTLDVYDPLNGCFNIPIDVDGDGYTVCEGDCDDSNPDVHPNHPELCNGIDDNCDGITDGYGSDFISGCTNPVACNYTPGAVCDDGSCTFGYSPSTGEILTPLWTATDMDGVTFDLQTTLNQGFTVVLDLFTYWCPPSQQMFSSGFLYDWNAHLGPAGQNIIRMVSVEIEGNPNNNVNPYNDFADWPIINGDGVNIGNLYSNAGLFNYAVPTIIIICPDYTTTVIYPDPIDLPAQGFFVYSPELGWSVLNSACSCRSEIPPVVGCSDVNACNFMPEFDLEECLYEQTYYYDADGDGYGLTEDFIVACEQFEPYVSLAGDCNDDDPFTFPGAPELCDLQDNNCNGLVDEGLDNSSDGFNCGECGIVCGPGSICQDGICVELCPDSDNDGFSVCAGDCDDNDELVFPGSGCDTCPVQITIDFYNNQQYYEGLFYEYLAPCFATADPEACMIEALDAGVLNGSIPVDLACYGCILSFMNCVMPGCNFACDPLYGGCETCIASNQCRQAFLQCLNVADSDGDGWADGSDCQAFNPQIYPTAIEQCDGVDNNCNFEVDEGDGLPQYQDLDGDGFGTTNFTITGCNPVNGFSFLSGDCDDTNLNIYPGAFDICGDGIDMNCDGSDECVDTDGDGIQDDTELGLGMNPFDPDSDADGLQDNFEIGNTINPTDSDGDGLIDPIDDDDDNDGIPTSIEFFGALFAGEDVDGDGIYNWLDLNSDGDAFPDSVEGLNDLNSDNLLDFLDPLVPTNDNDLDGYSPGNGDCDDNNSAINPGALDICDGIDNDCDGVVDELCVDDDFDGLNYLEEVSIGTDPYNPDTDSDGLNDGDEYLTHGTNPLDPDSDDDGILDGAEVNVTSTNPNNSDTDGDGCNDLTDWGNQCPGSCIADINEDGQVTTADLLIMLGSLGISCNQITTN